MYVSSIIIVGVLIASPIFAEDSKLTDVLPEKRAPMGFQGMRGKKDMMSSLETEEFSKRAPMGFQGMRGKKDPTGPDLMDNIIQDEFEKGTPMDLQDLRRKKDLLTLPDIKEALYQEEYDKRAPMRYQGMRGNKELEEFLEEMKRASMGFHGMRGKKIYQDDYEDEYEKRALPMGFQGMRGKRDEYERGRNKRTSLYLPDIGHKSLMDRLENMKFKTFLELQEMDGQNDLFDGYYPEYADPDGYKKRAPMGFQGVRGKRDEDKRGSMGFVGMRGKRNVGGIYGAEDDEYREGLPADFLGQYFRNQNQG
uniref:Atk_0 protein n=1 Tax=Fopius arisanus TaxID=64838 RepID=A0A0C9RQT7_9HYME